MLSLKTRIVDKLQRIREAAEKASFRNLSHAIASIRKTARESIEQEAEASPPGWPPHTRKGQLPRAILFVADADSAIAGPVESIVGTSGAAHEFGGEYKGGDYPDRSFMGPSLQLAVPRLAGDWAGSIGE